MSKFAAVQQQGLRTPIVYGLGDTQESAMDDAAHWAPDADDLTVYPCSDALADAAERGFVSCEIVDGVARAFGE